MIAYLKNRNIWPFMLMALYPLMPENIGSMVLTLAVLVVGYDLWLTNRSVNRSFKLAVYTLPFWMFFLYEVLVGPFDLTVALRFLTFLVIPLLFYNRVDIFSIRLRNSFILLFQIVMFIIGVYFLILFLGSNSIFRMLDVNAYNIPFFRDFIGKHGIVKIHPTYLSSFFLISFTCSLVSLLDFRNIIKSQLLLHFGNMVFTSFLLFLFSSRIVEIAWILTLIVVAGRLVSMNKKYFLIVVSGMVIFIGSVFIIFNETLVSRFNEIRTEYNKPVQGDYHNSTNIRMAIIHCSIKLIKSVPVLGYGNEVQANLNSCFEESYDSDFYTIHDYNSHNFYIHLVLFGGWGFLFLFSFYLIFVFIGIKHSFVAILIFGQLVLINLTESYFVRHFGIVTFNYFMLLFVIPGTNLGPKKKVEFLN